LSPPPVSRDLAQATIAAIEDALKNGHKPLGHTLGRHELGCVNAVARKLASSHSVISNRLRQAKALYNLEPDWSLYVEPEPGRIPGFAVKTFSQSYGPDGEYKGEWVKHGAEPGPQFTVPDGHAIKGVSALVDADGRVQAQWVKTGAGQVDPAAFCRELEEHFASFKPCAEPVEVPELKYEDQLTLYPFSDPHFGLLVWQKEAKSNWDLKIAVNTFQRVFSEIVARNAPTKQAIFLVGGDTLHADNNLNRTPQSGHALQVDGRHQNVMLTACETLVQITDLILTKHETVDLIVLPGNHDETSAYPIAMFLHAWYRNEPRVKVDLSPSLFRFREFGKVMIGTTHGHTVKAKDMPQIMAARQAEMWGRTKARFIHTFHVHHSSKPVDTIGGCIVETHEILAPQDGWHFGAGFLSGRSLQSICYDRERGEVSRVRVAVG
jgi:hypothetical protein